MPKPLVRRSGRIAPIVVAALVAGCGTGGPPSPAAAASPVVAVSPAGATPEAAASASAPAPADATPVPAQALAEPPVALLVGDRLPGEPAVGDLGSSTWGEQGSDAPWIVSTSGVLATPSTPVGVTFDPVVAPPAWTVRWAPITAAGAGEVASAAEGSGDVAFAVPDRPGAWSLQLEARFEAGHSATWYWRVDVQ